MVEGVPFLLGVVFGALLMLFIILKIIIEMHNQAEQNLRGR